MGLLTLYTGALLPWLGGTLWLMFADARFADSGNVNRYRQIGYGFFLGYAILFMAIMASDKLAGAVSWPGLMLFLSLFALGGAIAFRYSPKPARLIPAAANDTSTLTAKFVLAIVVALTAVHLAVIAIEIFTQPLFPWDAWLAWVYRAKAWFLSGGISDMVSAKQWAAASTANVYTIDAWQYPLFPSVVPYWAALSLGRWSETLVNLPVLFAGLAIGMALYGQCREQGLSITVSLVACYLLFSIPLLGTHLALAGYADIWMAGFTGLGFIAVMRGALTRDAAAGPGLQTVLGLLMIFFSIWVKNEGAVWFLAALVMIILVTCRPRVPILIAITMAVVTLAAFASGLNYFDIPLIGKLGFAEGRMFIPFIGDFRLEAHDVLPVYWSNFFKMGNWNLFWVAIASGLVLGFNFPGRKTGNRTRRTAMSLILIFIATQMFIFGFTDQGLWADTYTAINRLPIHFVPALLFAVGIIYHARLAAGVDMAATSRSPGNDND